MIYRAEYIEQPLSGRYIERIFDVKSPWNSNAWTWIKFEDKNGEWCGNFRGEYRGVVVSEKWGIVIVLTSDYMFVLDINTADVLDCLSQPDEQDITTSPYGDIFLSSGYDIEVVDNVKNGKLSTMPISYIPVNPDNLKFSGWNGSTLKIRCYEFLNWGNEIELYLDCKTLEWVKK